MPEDDWSDSDEDVASGMQTDVLLGVPDGSVQSDADIKDAAVSRIGGLPAFLPLREPPSSSCQCKVCSDPMELLLQVWCPFEDSPMDRALYVWGCARSTCQRCPGSIRAWRGLRHNAAYAAKLEKKKTQIPLKNLSAYANPFSVSSSARIHPYLSTVQSPTAQPTAFGLGNQIFGNPPTDIADQLEQDHSDADSDDSQDSLITAMTLATVKDSFWAAAPAYPAVYLSTLSEYIPQPSKAKASATSARVEDPVEADGKAGKDMGWALEAYENSLRTDNVFDRFTKRVGFTGEQCLRYELGGIPLPFASDNVFELLFPAANQAPLPVTKGDFKVVQPTKRSYSTASIPPCPCCKSNRVFECQLMPNLINVLRDTADNKDVDVRRLTDEQRIKAVQDVLKRRQEPGSRGMEWGTCMVFSCEKDCCMDDEECWREEYVLVQWDD